MVPPDVVVIGNHAWVTPDNSPRTGTATYGPTAYVGDAGAAADDLAVGNALQTRWLASPEHLAAPIAHADHFREADRTGRDSPPAPPEDPRWRGGAGLSRSSLRHALTPLMCAGAFGVGRGAFPCVVPTIAPPAVTL
ncbi:hypothetical protein CW362_21685 [Streptomyces populi]|uniref:Uncharacterized protein n=1 Tax=Streptomyces populi TaxID=2058924 RepID=A0A2I0SLX2_9ACTN|nr:hypothetical protein CW362_21685 [Streptomyces populi]